MYTKVNLHVYLTGTCPWCRQVNLLEFVFVGVKIAINILGHVFQRGTSKKKSPKIFSLAHNFRSHLLWIEYTVIYQ